MGEVIKLFLVSTGDYSDYSVMGIFDSNIKAKEFIDGHGPRIENFNDIEEFVLNPEVEERFTFNIEGLFPFTVVIDNTRRTYSDLVDDWDAEDIELCKSNFVEYESISKSYCFYLLAKTKEHAIKIANDKFSQILATVGFGKLMK